MRLLRQLNPQQQEAVQAIEGPLLILAGAGTGKTRVITSRIAYMIHQGISGDHILGVTFTNKAAREMRDRIRSLIVPKKQTLKSGPAATLPLLTTFHSLGARILRKHIDRLGYKTNFVIYDEADQLGILKKILSRFSLGDTKIDPREMLAAFSRLRNGMATGTAPVDAAQDYIYQNVLKQYCASLKSCNAVDFDDLLLLPLRLFEEHPEVLEYYRDQFRYVMVDEYQDTNAIQFKLLMKLTESSRNLCVVGDDDQSIYGWRGAEIANLLNLEKYFPEIRIVKLEQNYRSTNTILKTANALIQNNARRREKNLWSDKGQGETIPVIGFEDEHAEAKAVVDQIEAERLTLRVPWRDQAILFRTNLQARPIETALRQAGVVYKLIGGQSYFDRKEIKDFLAYLKFLQNPDDDASLLRIANTPPRGLSPKSLECLIGLSHEWNTSVYKSMQCALESGTDDLDLQLSTRAMNAIQKFVDWAESVMVELDSKELELGEWAEGFMEEVGYWEEVRKFEKDPTAAENRIINIRELARELESKQGREVSLVDQITGRPARLRLQEALERFSLDADWKQNQDEESRGDWVTLITAHSCKGLEFPRVHVVGVEEGLMPHSRSKVEGTTDEERRLFYVAITRAMESLRITFCNGRKRYGELTPCHPSSFLDELPEETVERQCSSRPKKLDANKGKQMFSDLLAALSADEAEAP